MSEETVYLIYNTNATNFKLQQGSQPEDLRSKMWEYIDKDEFTIMYSKEDERNYTDIKILSKTKLKERPQSSDELQKKPRGSVEGIIYRRSNSLPNIEGDLFCKKRSPLIKPLLSETEILTLQEIHETCRKQKFGYDKKGLLSNELSEKGHFSQPGFENQSALKNFYDWKHSPKPQSKTEVFKISPLELRKKRKPSSHPLEPDTNIQTNNKTKKNAHLDNLGAALSKTINSLPTVKNKKEITKNSYFKDNKSDKNKLFQSKAHSKAKVESDLKRNQNTTSTLNITKKVNSSKEKDKLLQKTNENVLKPNLSDKNNNYNSMNETVESKPKYPKNKPSKSIHSPKEKALKNNGEQEFENKFKTLKSKSQEGVQEKERKLKQRITAVSDGSESNKTKKGLKLLSSDKEKNKQLAGSSSLNVSGSEKYATSSDINKVSSEHSKKKQKNFQNTKDALMYETGSPKSKLFENKEESSKKRASESENEKSTLDKENQSNLNKNLKTPKNNVGFEEFDRSKNNKENYNLALPKGKKYSNLIQYMIQYVLSNPVFIKLGWTLHQTDPFKTRLVTFKALPSNSKSYFLRHRDKSEIKYYPSGCLAMEILEIGTGRLNYSSGSPAIVVSKNDSGMIMKLYSDPVKDLLIKKSFETRVLGVFDSFGNGVVYDDHGEKTLVFNQMKGFYYKRENMIYKWKWSSCEVLEAYHLKELLATMVIDAKKLPKPSTKRARSISRSHSVSSAKQSEIDKMYYNLLAELPHPEVPNLKVKEKSHKTGFKPIILKINKEITLRINSQESIILNFSGHTFFYKMDLGVRIDPETVVRIDEIDLDTSGGIPCILDV